MTERQQALVTNEALHVAMLTVGAIVGYVWIKSWPMLVAFFVGASIMAVWEVRRKWNTVDDAS